MTDIITQEIRDIRHRLAAAFDNDLEEIVCDLVRRQDKSNHKLIDRSGSANCQDNKPLNGSNNQTPD